jgi:hypothetical protein
LPNKTTKVQPERNPASFRGFFVGKGMTNVYKLRSGIPGVTALGSMGSAKLAIAFFHLGANGLEWRLERHDGKT